MEQTTTATLGELVTAEPALGRLLKLSLPIKTAYHVSKLAALVGQETRHFYERRQALFVELGEQRAATADEQAQHGGRVIVIPEAHVPAFQERLNALAEIPVAIAWRPVPLSELSGITIAGEDLLALGPLIEGAA